MDLGINLSVSPENLRLGEASWIKNMDIDIERSAVVLRGGYKFIGEIPSLDVSVSTAMGAQSLVNPSDNSIYDFVLFKADSGDTTTNQVAYSARGLSAWVLNSDVTEVTTDGWADSVAMYTPGNFGNTAGNHVIFSTGSGEPIIAGIGEASTMTNINSQLSSPKYIAAVDERLVLFNSTVATVAQPQRVSWSIKGDPFDFTSIGAGFQDLVEMSGNGTGIVADRDRLIIFSDNEIWEGRPRADIFSFDFFPISTRNGCPYPRTIVATDKGVMWVGQDLNVYLLQGNRIITVGTRIQRVLTDQKLVINGDKAGNIWATFQPDEKHYRVHYAVNDQQITTAIVLHTGTLEREEGPAWTAYVHPRIQVGHESLVFEKNSSTASAGNFARDHLFDGASQIIYGWYGSDIGIPNLMEMATEIWIEYNSRDTFNANSSKFVGVYPYKGSSYDFTQLRGAPTNTLMSSNATFNYRLTNNGLNASTPIVAYLPLGANNNSGLDNTSRAQSSTVPGFYFSPSAVETDSPRNFSLHGMRIQLRQYTGKFPPL